MNDGSEVFDAKVKELQRVSSITSRKKRTSCFLKYRKK